MYEVWKDVIIVDATYQVSNLGNVRNADTLRVLSPSKDKCGYLHCYFRRNKQTKTITVHRLVAKAFIENPQNKPEINHKDGNKQNNAKDNLEFVTRKENVRHAIDSGLFDPCKNGGWDKRKVVSTAKASGEKQSFDSIFSASISTGVWQSSICSSCQGKRKSAGGYLWAYAD